jgi:hypothetical protein
MSEQPEQPRRSVDGDEGRPAGTDKDAGGHGNVRTAGETSVDEAIGTGEDPAR